MEKQNKKQIWLPLLALFLDFLPILAVPVLGLSDGLRFFGLFSLFSPIIGMVLGVVALTKGKEKIGTLGKVIAIIAVALPASLLALIPLFFIGATTGIIGFM